MHEAALMNDLVRKVKEIAASQGLRRVTTIKVVLGALSHMTQDHFQEHFEISFRGTIAEGATIEAEMRTDIHEPNAQGIILKSITGEE